MAQDGTRTGVTALREEPSAPPRPARRRAARLSTLPAGPASAEVEASGTADGDATVHLRLRGTIGDDELSCLRQQLAACLRSGVRDLRVHAEEQEDLDVGVLHALDGVHAHLTRTGGSIALLGARPRVRSKVAVHGLGHLLAAGEATPGR